MSIDLSSRESEYVNELNESVKYGVMSKDAQDAFLECSIAALIQHAIDMSDFEEVQGLLEQYGH